MLRLSYADRQPKNPQPRPRIALAIPVIGLGLALGGCSADFLRFDAPVFNLNGDTSDQDTRVSQAPLSNQQPDTYGAGAPSGARSYAAAPVSGVSGGPVTDDTYAGTKARLPATTYDQKPPADRYAANQPIVATPPAGQADSRSGYEPVTTGALASRNHIIVERGDTLYQLSRRHGVTVAALRRANGLSGNTIRPGQRLTLPATGDDAYASAPRQRAPEPAPSYREPTRSYREPVASPAGGSYVVRRGDSLYAISRRTGVSVDELKRLNGITNVRAIRPGLRLSLGGEAAQPEAPETQVAARTNVTPRSQIRRKTIRTLPIVRDKTAPIGDVQRPRILNQRPETPITTKPQPSVTRAPVTETEQTFRWPARGRVIAKFNHSGQGTKNDGINIALPFGTDITAADDGTVAYAGSELQGYGNLVLVRHDNGWVSAYAHASEVLVKRGDRISRGQVIAKVGRSGGVTQPQLHFELRKGAKPVDPMPHLANL